MACRNCYKYPLCEKCESPKGICSEFKKKRIEFEKEKENLTIEVQKYKTGENDFTKTFMDSLMTIAAMTPEKKKQLDEALDEIIKKLD